MTSPVNSSGVVPDSTVSPVTASPRSSCATSYGAVQSGAGSAELAAPPVTASVPSDSPAAMVAARARARPAWIERVIARCPP
jgi:hypothetical protein